MNGSGSLAILSYVHSHYSATLSGLFSDPDLQVLTQSVAYSRGEFHTLKLLLHIFLHIKGNALSSSPLPVFSAELVSIHPSVTSCHLSCPTT